MGLFSGLFSQDEQLAGYAVDASFCYVLAENGTHISEYYRNSDSVFYNPAIFNLVLHTGNGSPYVMGDYSVSISSGSGAPLEVLNDTAYNNSWRVIQDSGYSLYGTAECIITSDRTININSLNGAEDVISVVVENLQTKSKEVIRIYVNSGVIPDKHLYLVSGDIVTFEEILIPEYSLYLGNSAESYSTTGGSGEVFPFTDYSPYSIYKDFKVVIKSEATSIEGIGKYSVKAVGTIPDKYYIPIAKQNPTFSEMQTGEVSTINGSVSGKSQVTIRNTNILDTIPEMQTFTGYDIKYRNVFSVVYNNSFIGDNSTSLPKYTYVLTNKNYDKVISERTASDANPINVIYNLIKYSYGLDNSAFDLDSFINAAIICEQECISISVFLKKSTKITDLFEDIEKIIDGVVFIDRITQKVTVKLFRDDYDKTTLVQLTDSEVAELKLQNQSASSLPNKFTVEYQNPTKEESSSKVIYNQAGITNSSVIKSETISLLFVSNATTLDVVTNRIIAKRSIPLRSFTFKIGITDSFQFSVGDVVKLSSAVIGLAEVIIRIVEIAGDKQDTPYYTVKAVEDYYQYTSIQSSYTPIGSTETLLKPDPNDMPASIICVGFKYPLVDRTALIPTFSALKYTKYPSEDKYLSVRYESYDARLSVTPTFFSILPSLSYLSFPTVGPISKTFDPTWEHNFTISVFPYTTLLGDNNEALYPTDEPIKPRLYSEDALKNFKILLTNIKITIFYADKEPLTIPVDEIISIGGIELVDVRYAKYFDPTNIKSSGWRKVYTYKLVGFLRGFSSFNKNLDYLETDPGHKEVSATLIIDADKLDINTSLSQEAIFNLPDFGKLTATLTNGDIGVDTTSGVYSNTDIYSIRKPTIYNDTNSNTVWWYKIVRAKGAGLIPPSSILTPSMSEQESDGIYLVKIEYNNGTEETLTITPSTSTKVEVPYTTDMYKISVAHAVKYEDMWFTSPETIIIL